MPRFYKHVWLISAIITIDKTLRKIDWRYVGLYGKLIDWTDRHVLLKRDRSHITYTITITVTQIVFLLFLGLIIKKIV